MKKLFVVFLLISVISEAQTLNESVLFDYNQFFLTEKANSILDETLSKVDVTTIKSIQIFGNTDSDGDSKYNSELSKKRAETVSAFLTSKGILKEKITINSNGENKPIAENQSDFGKQKNRRVDLIIEFFEKEVTNMVFEKFQKESQFFEGKSNEEIVIHGKEGTLIKIPKNALLKLNNKYAVGKIKIELKEFYTKSEIVLNNLHSMSSNEMLETGGMIYLKATSNNEELKLKKNAKISIEMASKNNPNDMETFYGYPNKDAKINWETNPNFDDIDNEFQVYAFTIVGRDSITDFREIKTKKFARDSVTERKLTFLDKTALKSAKLGWINCDRFYEVENKTNFAVTADLKYKPEIRLIFKDINSIMSAYIDDNNQFIFNNIPVGQKATLLAFSYVDDEMYFDQKEVEVSKDGIVEMNLAKTTIEDFQLKLKQLDN